MEFKSIKGIISYLEKNEAEYVEEFKCGEFSLYEGLSDEFYDSVREFSQDKFTNNDYKHLVLNEYSTYSFCNRYDLGYTLVMDYIETYFLCPNKYKTYVEFKKSVVEENKRR